MTESQAHEILNRVRAGDKKPTLMQINTALILSGDITTSVSAQSLRGLRDKADKALLAGFAEVADRMAASDKNRLALNDANHKRMESMQRATWCSQLVSHE